MQRCAGHEAAGKLWMCLGNRAESRSYGPGAVPGVHNERIPRAGRSVLASEVFAPPRATLDPDLAMLDGRTDAVGAGPRAIGHKPLEACLRRAVCTCLGNHLGYNSIGRVKRWTGGGADHSHLV